MDERDALRVWRELFRGQEITPEALAKAETLLDDINGESPLHIRFSNELRDLKKLRTDKQVVPATRRKSK